MRNKTAWRNTHLQVPCPVTRNPIAINPVSQSIEVLARLEVNFTGKEGVPERKFDTFNWVTVVEHKLILRGISRQGNHSRFPWRTTWQEFDFPPKGSGTVKGETELYYLTIFSATPFGVSKLLTSPSERNSSMSFIDMPERVRNPAISHSPLERNGWYGLILRAPASSSLRNHPRNPSPESNT